MGIPGWALALAAPYGLEKFVMEPAVQAYGMAQGIRNDINTREDDEVAQGMSKKLAGVKSLEQLSAMEPDLQNLSTNSAASYNNILKQFEAKRTELTDNYKTKSTAGLLNKIMTSQDPQAELKNYIDSGGEVYWDVLQKTDKAMDETRKLFADAYKQKEDAKKEKNEKAYYAGVSELASKLTPEDNTPFNAVLGDVYNLASQFGVDPAKVASDLDNYYTKSVGPQQEFKTGRTTAIGQKNKHGEIKKDAQSVAPVIKINNGGGTDGGFKLARIRKADGRIIQVNLKSPEGLARAKEAIKNGEPIVPEGYVFPTTSTNHYDSATGDTTTVRRKSDRIIGSQESNGKSSRQQNNPALNKDRGVINVTYDKDGKLIIKR